MNPTHKFIFHVKRNKLHARHLHTFVLLLMIIVIKLLILHTFPIIYTSRPSGSLRGDLRLLKEMLMRGYFRGDCGLKA
jgi:hypothetical protein